MKKNLYITIVFVFFSAAFANANSETTFWSENFEGDWTANWYVDAGTWEAGIPTSGPNAAHAGDNCAATILGGKYPTTANTRLIRFSKFTVPEVTQNPRLRFWHWYSISTADYGKVQIKPEGSTDWVDISGQYVNTGSGVWTYPSLDLSDYAGQTVQIAFFFHAADAHPYNTESSGWYIDDISVVTGTPIFNNPETWESGLGDWDSEFGTWEVGTPKYGAAAAHGGEQCAATVLGGKYATNVDSRLTSPNFTVPAANQSPRLRFWHWYSFSTADYGRVQIKPAGSTEWVDISGKYVNTGSGVWAHPSLDLSEYAGQTVQIAFFFQARDAHPYNTESSGWYIDDISVVTGTPIFNNPETWESGLGDWDSEFGTWEVGTPKYGAAAAHGGEQCAATVLGGKYATNVDSRLTSPNFTVPAANQSPRLRFWHWYSFSTADYGKVQIKRDGSTEWIDISGNYISTSGSIWTYAFIDLTNYAGQTVQIAFFFQARDAHPYNTESSGWYIDDIIIEGDNTQSNKTDILAFSFGIPPQSGDATIDATAKTIDIEVEYGTDLTNLISTFTLSDGATAKVGAVAQVSGTTENDFTSPVTYAVTAEDGTTVQDWIVTVTVAPNTEAEMVDFTFGTPPQLGDATIDITNRTINIGVFGQTDVTNLISTFTLSDGATVKVGGIQQVSGTTANDFSNPVTYTVSAEDGTTMQDWIVIVTIPTRINEIALHSLKIYPNPFTDKAMIEFDNIENLKYSIVIFNLAGNKVFEMKDITSDKIELKRGNLTAGVYIVELKGAINYGYKRIVVR